MTIAIFVCIPFVLALRGFSTWENYLGSFKLNFISYIKNKWLGTSFRSPFGKDSTKEGENIWNPLLYLTTLFLTGLKWALKIDAQALVKKP